MQVFISVSIVVLCRLNVCMIFSHRHMVVLIIHRTFCDENCIPWLQNTLNQKAKPQSTVLLLRTSQMLTDFHILSLVDLC